MTQLTSRIAIFLFNTRSPQVTERSIPGIRNEPCTRFSPSSLPMMGQPVHFCFGCLSLPDPPCHTSRYGTIFQLRSLTKGGMDSNHVAHSAAARFYCEYRTRERIHRSVADLRLLAIPASWGQVAAPNPNWGDV